MRADTAIERPSAWDDGAPMISIGGPGSEVFRARARGSDRAVALRLWCGTSNDDVLAARERIEQAKRVSHPMLASVEACEARGNAALWIVSEYVPGPTLEAWAAGGRVLPVAAAIDFMRRLSLGVQAALAEGVSHHAINPRNVVVWRQDPKSGLQLDGKLLDLGLAAWMCPELPQLDCAHFMAPETLCALFGEQNVQDAFGARANVYSCGALLYYLTTGELPFRSESVPQLMAAQAAGPHELVRPSAYNELISPALECVILGALAVRAGERYASPGEFASVLDAVELRDRRATMPPPEPVMQAAVSAAQPSAAAESEPQAELHELELPTQPSAAAELAPQAELHELELPTQPSAAVEPATPELAAAAQPPSAAAELSAQAGLAAFALPASAAELAASGPAQLPSLAAAATQLPTLAESTTQLPPLPTNAIQLPTLASCSAEFVARLAELSPQPPASLESIQQLELEMPELAWGTAAEERLSVAPPEPLAPRSRTAARPWLRVFAVSIGLGVYFCFPSVTRAPNVNAARATDAIMALPQVTPDSESVGAQPVPAPAGAVLPLAQPAPHAAGKAISPEQSSAPQRKTAEPVVSERPTPTHARRPAVSPRALLEAPTADIAAVSEPITPSYEALQPASQVSQVLQTAAAIGGSELDTLKTRPTAPPPQPPTGEARIKALEVRGSLTTSAVRRAMERVRPHWTACYEQVAGAHAQTPSTPVHFALVIDEAGRAREPHVTGAGSAAFTECLSRATSKLTADKPDTGTVDVLFDLHFAH
jgi:hypothetical protein